jgi:hypothetical protein
VDYYSDCGAASPANVRPCLDSGCGDYDRRGGRWRLAGAGAFFIFSMVCGRWRACDFEYGVQMGESQDIANGFAGIDQSQIHSRSVQRNKGADSSGVDGIRFFEIENDSAPVLAYGGAQQGGLMAADDSSGAVKDGSFSEIFNRYIQHDGTSLF